MAKTQTEHYIDELNSKIVRRIHRARGDIYTRNYGDLYKTLTVTALECERFATEVRRDHESRIILDKDRKKVIYRDDKK